MEPPAASDPLLLEDGELRGAGDLSCLGDAGLELLRSLIDAIPARVVVVDADERLVYANDDFFRFTGLHPKQVLGASIERIIGPAAYATYAPVRERLARGETVRWEGWTTLAAQGRRYMREHLVPVGRPQRATIVVSLDWTALRQRDAELSAKVRELQTTEALKSAIVDHALAAVVSTDEQGVIVGFNPAAERMFGHAQEAVIGREVGEVIIPERHRDAHRHGMERMSRGEAPRVMGRRVEMPALRADGSEFPVEMVIWRTAVAGTAYYTASMFDLTERHAAEREIERQREALRHSDKLTAMGSLLAGVAHELNNPLAIVMGRASLLEDKMAGQPLADDAARIREAAERCGRIVRTFLNMARQRPSARTTVALNDLARAAVEILQYGLRAHGIEVATRFADGLPSIQADADQLGQVVLNLVVNAQHALAAHDGPRVLEVATGAGSPESPAAEAVWLRVRDSGPGVPAEVRERIFEPFFTTKAEGAGTGLGLAVSRSIATEHGGELRLEAASAVGGASFLLLLPLRAAGVAADPEAARDDDDDAPAASRVLVVDDEAEIADLIRAFLEGAGHEVAVAESGAVALELLAEARFDAVVSDLRMPDMDGAQLWREVRTRHPALAARMLFVTGDTLSPGARSFLDETGCPMLDKPFARADLLARVKALLHEGESQ